jgi:hypothetical protein
MTYRQILTTSARGTALLAALALASACAMPPKLEGRASQPPPARSLPEASTSPSPASIALRRYYANVQAELLSQGLMRTDTGAKDAPFNARMLAANFTRIAFFDEFDTSSGTLVARPTEKRLRRWAAPIRVGLDFGASTPVAQRDTERARVRSFLARLSKITGHPIQLATTNINFHLQILDTDEIRAIGPTVRQIDPTIGQAEVASITNMPDSTYCQVTTSIDDRTSLITRAFAVIRAEHPDLLRLSCLHEETAQGLGLPNDSPAARPSIFNDDQEFALLTPMDEMMLQMLYDARLTPGMTATQAAPTIAQLAEALVGGDS